MRMFFISTCLVAFISSPVMSENWPQWRGSQHNGISTEKGLPTKWSKDENIKWRTPMPGQGGATPVVWGDKLFVTSASGDDLVVLCIAADTGKVIWNKKVASGNQDARAGEGNSASPSPCTDGEHVWVFFSTGVLACLDIQGNEVWKFDVGERFGKLDIQFGMTSSPVLDGDGLYLQLIHGAMQRNNDQRTGKAIKLDKKTGKTQWEVDRVTKADFECKHSYASPSVYNDGKEKFLVVHGADCTTGHSLVDGKELWRLSNLNGPSNLNTKGNDITFRFVSSPGLAPGHIIVPTAKGGPTVSIAVSDALKGEVSKNNSIVKWVDSHTPDVSIPLIVDGLVYNVHKDGKVQCLDLATGKENYFERVGTGEHRSSPLYADGHIVICGREGTTSVIKTGPALEKVSVNDLGESTTASPVFANGVLYIRTYDALYAIGKK